MSTSTTIKKFFTDFDAEEAWLNQMSAQGKELVNYRGGTYTFTTSEPHTWQYAIEVLGTTSKESRDYLSFLEDMGIETVSTYAGRVYLRKKDDGTPLCSPQRSEVSPHPSSKGQFLAPHYNFTTFLCTGILCKRSFPTAISCRLRHSRWSKHCIHNRCGY